MDPKKVVTWPHAEGLARLAFSPDGLYLYTSGSEGYMRVFDADLTAETPFDPKLIEYWEEPITCLSVTNEFICSSNESGEVALHKAGSNEFASLVTRCSFPVRSARFDPKGRRIAVASDELIVKVIDAKDPLKVQLLAGHKKAVREVTWSPDGSLLTTSGSDGQIRVWELNGAEATCVQVLDGIIAASEPESEYTVEVVWHPSSKFFVVASKTNELVVISRDSWSKIGTFSAADGHSSQISALAFSPNGTYLATAAKEGTIIIWSTSTRSPINRTTHVAGLITALAFHPSPSANALAYTDFTGQLTRWQDPVPTHLPGPGAGIRGRSESVGQSEGGEREASEREEEDWIEDEMGMMVDEGAYAGEKELPPRLRGWDGEEIVSTTTYGKVQAQATFQPGSTPFRDKRRYLSFNMLGLIHVVERDDQNIVTIEFHDRSARTGSHFNDTFKFTLGSLGELGCIFASPSSSVSPSLLHYRPYDSWTPIQEWQYSLPAGESATVIAVGGMAEPTDSDEVGIAGTGTVIVGTDRGFVRFLSGSGLQKYVWNLGEEVVSAAAGRDWAVVVWAAGAGCEYALLDTDTFEVVQQGRMPLGKGATLQWVGFTEEQIPVMYDSNGLLSILDRSRRPRQARWVPALDTNGLARREGKQESYWPIGVTEQHVHVIILKGEEKYPHFPTPLFQEIDLQFPLLRLDVQQGQLEEQYLRETIFVSHRRDGASPDDFSLKALLARQEMETDKHLLKIIQTSCKAERLQAALDAALLLTQPASLDAAAKIAGFFGLPALEERIALVKEAKLGRREGEEGNKRKSKWAHLVDERTVVAPPPSTARNGKSANPFAASGNFSPRTSGAGFGSARKVVSTPARRGRMDSGFEGSDGVEGQEMEEEMEVDGEEEMGEWREEEEGEERASKRSRSGSEDQREVSPPVAAAPKKAANPFAKRPLAAKVEAFPSSPNPFPKKGAAKALDIQRTDSFFGRVEGKAAPKSKAKPRSSTTGPSATPTTVPGSRQTTLFGLAPGIAKPVEKKGGKKRKVAEAEEEVSKGLGAFLKPAVGGVAKELPREGEEFEETQLETQSGTQVELQGMEETQAGTQAETQEETQETQEESVQSPAADVPTQATPAADGLSKLERFRRVQAATPVVAEST